MALFLDASALVKGYVSERGSESVRSILARPDSWGGLFISEISAVEVPSAFTQKFRRKELTRAQLQTVLRTFSRHYPDAYDVVAVTTPVFQDAANLAAAQPDRDIRTGDAIQLASAQWVTRRLDPAPQLLMFVTADRKLKRAASRIGFDVYDPESDRFSELLQSHRGLSGL